MVLRSSTTIKLWLTLVGASSLGFAASALAFAWKRELEPVRRSPKVWLVCVWAGSALLLLLVARLAANLFR